MSNKSFCLIALILLVALAGNAQATTWDGGGDSSSWNDADNWDAGVPGASDTALITGATVVINGYTGYALKLKGNGCNISVINGGKLESGSGGYLTPSNTTPQVGPSILNVDATSMIDAWQMYAAYQPDTTTTLNVYGYARFWRTDTSALRMTILGGATARINIYDGGTVWTDGLDDGPGAALINIAGGSLILNGEEVTGLDFATAYDGDPCYILDFNYNGSTTTITALPIVPYILTVDVEPNNVGINTVSPSAGQHAYEPNTVVNLRAADFIECPDVDSFDHWVGDVNDVNSPLTTIFMNANKTVEAVFVSEHLYGDLTANCKVNYADVRLFVDQWLAPNDCPGPNCADFDDDGDVDMPDFRLLAGNWKENLVKLQSIMLNVKDFGAIGDGQTNDTVAIQAAIDAAWYINADGYRRAGGIVYFPPGKYRTTEPIRLHSYVVLTSDEGQYRGNERGAEINSSADAGLVFWEGDWVEQTIVAETKTGWDSGLVCSHVFINNLAVKANKFAVHTMGCNSSNLRIENCRFEAGTAAFVSTGDLMFALFNNVTCQKGLWFLQEQGRFSKSEVSNIRLGLDSVNNEDWSIRLEGCIQCVSLRNITFESQENGILLDAKYSGANITIDGIWSYDVPTPDEVVRIKSGDAIRVSNVLASDQASAFNVEGGSRIFLQGIMVGGEYIDLHGCTTATTFGCPRVINAGSGSVIEGVVVP